MKYNEVVCALVACELSLMTETTERLLREIADRIGRDRVAELYLFPVVRQSEVEAAVAVIAAHPELDANSSSDPVITATEHPRRHVVYMARYRLTVKGTERGKWVIDVVAEADAPLITVEEVVRGVVRRSGDAFQPEHITGDQLRAIVPAPAAPTPVPV